LQLHEQTQRFILLLIFYLFGPVLMLCIIGGIVVRKLPANARSWEQSLAQQTGLYWTIESVEYRSPGFVRLHSVTILDESAQHPIFLAKVIDVQLVTDPHRAKTFPDITVDAGRSSGLTARLVQTFPSLQSGNRFWNITVPYSILNFSTYSSEDSALFVQNTLHRLLSRFETLSDVPMQFVLEEIAVISEYSLQKEGSKIEDKVDFFRFVKGNIYQTPTEIRSDWELKVKDFSDFDALYFSLMLSLNNTVNISFQTGRQPIPCDLAAVFCSLFKHFSGGSFLGKFALSSRMGRADSSTIRLDQVTFKDVPLAPLAKPYTGFAVEGMITDLQLQQAVFGAEPLYVEGHLLVQHGAVETALFHSCIGRFQLGIEPDSILLDLSLPMIPFTECAIHFRLRPDGIDFWADQRWGNTLMFQALNADGSGGMRLSLPETRRIVTYHELMSIFAPDNAPVVPLTPGLQAVLPYIPIP
jgi:hypothetical protein